jgi:hypothetical protein
MKLIYLIVALLSLSALPSLYAKEHEERLRFTDTNGESITVGLTAYKNKLGELEVRVDAAGMPKLLDKFNPTIAFGRDLDDDQKIDTWFIITKKGIETERIQGNDPLGKDVLPKLLFKKHPTSAGLYLSAGTTTLLSYILLTAKESMDKDSQYVQDWINLEELKIRLDTEVNSDSNSLTREQIQFQYFLISQGYKNMADEMEKFAKSDFWKWAGADVGLWISGSYIFKTAAGLLVKAGMFITDTTLYLTIKEEIAALITKNIAILRDKGAAITEKIGFGRTKAEEVATVALSKMSMFRIRTTITAAITSQILKNKMIRIATPALKWPGKIVQGAMSEWKYIALNSGIQITAETVARYDDVYDPNPFIMAKNVLTNEDVLQNIGFMTTDTILMTGLSKNLTSTKARLLVSGFIGLQDSVIINLVIKNEDNYKRVALDTGWESVIGNAQVQIDLKALEAFEKMALKKNNPRLKLLGYAVVLVDQGIGFVTYSKASDKIKKSSKEPSVKIIPVLAEK